MKGHIKVDPSKINHFHINSNNGILLRCPLRKTFSPQYHLPRLPKQSIISLIYLTLFLWTTIALSQANILARVNGENITREQLHSEMLSPVFADLTIGLNPSEAKLKILNNIIDKRILLLEADAQRIQPNPNIVEEYFRKQRLQFGSEEQFRRELHRRNLSEKQYRQVLLDELRVTELLYRNVYFQLDKLQPITMEEAQKYYLNNRSEFSTPDRIRLRHIFILVPPNADENIKNQKLLRIQEALHKIKQGINFAQVATDYSETDRAEYGGDLGRFIQPGELSSFPEIEKIAFSLGRGQHSDIIETEFGYHIIYIEEKKEGHLLPFESVRAEILNILTKQRVQTLYNDWFNQVKAKYPVEIYYNNL